MRSLNKLLLIGNVGSDPEIRSTAKGTKVAKFSLATNEKAGENERTEWHRCAVFGKLADVVEQYVTCGDRLYVEGKVEYTKTDDGKFFTDVIVRELVMLGSSKPAAPAEKPAFLR